AFDAVRRFRRGRGFYRRPVPPVKRLVSAVRQFPASSRPPHSASGSQRGARLLSPRRAACQAPCFGGSTVSRFVPSAAFGFRFSAGARLLTPPCPPRQALVSAEDSSGPPASWPVSGPGLREGNGKYPPGSRLSRQLVLP